MTLPSYQVVIDLLNLLNRYHNQLLIVTKFEHRTPCTIQFHGMQVFTQQTREELLDKLILVEEECKKIIMPQNLQELLARKLKVFGAQLTRQKNATEYPDLFVATVCNSLKE